MKFPTVALMGNAHDARVMEALRTLTPYLLARGVEVVLADAVALEAIPGPTTRVPEQELAHRATLAIAVGGDGSMLRAARLLAGTGVPLLGINRGRLGFLADVGPTDMLLRLDEVLRGEYESEQRMLLSADLIEGGTRIDGGLALNDIVISRHDPGRMLDIRTFIDGRYVNTQGGDGIIVATATGSTAYALSCGGPIVAPTADVILLVPICPHTLSERPIIVPASATTEIRLSEPHSTRADVSCDGEVIAQLIPGRSVQVRTATVRIELVHPRGYDYFHILRDKLHWGRDHHSPAPHGN